MSKNTYSIILTDEVVEAIDALAAHKGTSRSNLINQILAEHVCYVTPERRMKSIFSVMEQQMQDIFRIQMQASDAMFSMQSVLCYKYRPTIRYSVELLRHPNSEKMGYLKISCRTQNSTLLDAIDLFFRMWIEFEIKYHPYLSKVKVLYKIEPGKMTRALSSNPELDETETGDAISNYVQHFDTLIKYYFSILQQGLEIESVVSVLEKQYKELCLSEELTL